MAAKKRYSVRDIRLAIDKVGASIADIAAELTCARSTVRRYLKNHPELAEYHAGKGGQMTSRKPSYERIKNAIEGSQGIYTRIAAKAGVSRQTVVNYMKENAELRELALEERNSLVDAAESKAFELIEDGDGPTVRFVLSTLGADRGYKSQQAIELSGHAISARAAALLEKMGKEPSEAMKQFEQMIELQAEKMGVSSSE